MVRTERVIHTIMTRGTAVQVTCMIAEPALTQPLRQQTKTVVPASQTKTGRWTPALQTQAEFLPSKSASLDNSHSFCQNI